METLARALGALSAVLFGLMGLLLLHQPEGTPWLAFLQCIPHLLALWALRGAASVGARWLALVVNGLWLAGLLLVVLSVSWPGAGAPGIVVAVVVAMTIPCAFHVAALAGTVLHPNRPSSATRRRRHAA